MKKYIGAQTMRAGRIAVSREEARRLDRFVMRVGRREAASRLGVGETTIDIATEQGVVLRKTHERLFEALARELEMEDAS